MSQLSTVPKVVQEPLQLGAREVGVDAQAGFGLDGVGLAVGPQLGTGGFGATVLPDDGVVNRAAGLAVPDHGGFALVGDAHGVHVTGLQPRFYQHLAGGGQLGAPDFHWVVLDPARLRVNLR
jgi:hypothetical protein